MKVDSFLSKVERLLGKVVATAKNVEHFIPEVERAHYICQFQTKIRINFVYNRISHLLYEKYHIPLPIN